MKLFKSPLLVALAGLFFGLTGVAHAALPEAVTTAISGAETDITTAGGLILAVVVGIAVIGWIRRVIR